MLRYSFFPAFRRLTPFFVFLFFCGRNPISTQSDNGQLEIRTRINNPSLAKSAQSLQTKADSVIIEISAEDMTTIRIARKIDFTKPALIDTVHDIPAGSNRRIAVKGVNQETVTHIDSESKRTADINPGQISVLNVELIPAAGSIYISLGSVPTLADSVYARFFLSSGDLLYETRVGRDPKVFFSIDNIPHNTEGTLEVILTKDNVDESKDTLYTASEEMVFDSRSVNSVDLQFMEKGGSIDCSVSIQEPGITLASYDFDTDLFATSESGELLITEIMYAANDSEYIELRNMSGQTVSFDTLIIDIDGGTPRKFPDIHILADSFLVIGRKDLPYVDMFHSTQSALDLSSNGNWITVRKNDGSVIDQVIFTGNTNDQEWPSFSGKKSIELISDDSDPIENNLGRNWFVATELIEGLVQCGTPGF
ncbi:MAG: lamin tail domain-containing protein [Chitinispirillaceae bacterium]